MKKILVCVKMVPVDHNVGIGSDYRLERTKVLHQLNIADMAAVEAALRQKSDAEVTVLTMGTKSAEAILKDLFARGVDRAVLLTDRAMAGADTRATAAAISAAVRKMGGFDLILCGRRAIDGETGQVPGELAAELQVPCITNVAEIYKIKMCEAEPDATAIHMSGSTASEMLHCRRLLENGMEELEAELPAVVSMCEYTYPLRLPSIRGRREAAGKQVEIWSAADLEIPLEKLGLQGSRTRVMKTSRLQAGLRKGPKETDTEIGVEKLLSIIREKRT